MSFLRNATGVLLTSIAESILGFATSIVLARWLSVEDRGLYAIAVTFGTTLVVISRLGLPSSAVYRMRRLGSPTSQVATATFGIGLGLTALLMGIAWLFEPTVQERLLEGAPETIFYLALATVPPQILLQLSIGLARGMDLFALANRYTLAANVAGMVAVTATLLLRGGDAAAALLAFAVSRTGVAIVFLIAVLRRTGFARHVSADEAKGSLTFALKSYMQVLAGQIHERVDIILIAWLLSDPQAVAFYTIAVGMIDRLKILPEAIASALFPRLSELQAGDAARFTGYVARHTLFWVGLALTGFAAVAPWFLPLAYGEPYAASVAPFLILLPAMAFHSLYKVVARYFMSLDRQRINIQTQGLALVVNVGLNLWLIPRYGISGAAFSSLVSYGLESLLIAIAFLWDSGLSARQAYAPRRADIAFYRTRFERLRRGDAHAGKRTAEPPHGKIP